MVSIMEKHPFATLVPKFFTALFLFLLALSAKNDYTKGDARLNLLTSQAIIEKGSIKLDAYLPKEVQPDALEAKWALYIVLGHYYNLYPPGASLFSVPFVAVANQLGYNMLLPQADKEVQRFLAALIFALFFLVLVSIAEKYLSAVHAWGFSLVFCLGTSLASSMALALWSQSYYILFCLLALLVLVQKEKSGNFKNAWLIAFPVFAAFLCRPVAVIPAVLIMFWLGKNGYGIALKYISVLVVLLGIFVFWSYQQYELLLPIYYSSTMLLPGEKPFLAAWGLLISPGRGLFLFSPFLLVALGGFFFTSLRKNFLYLMCFAWFMCQLILIARQYDWWGGWCYGPRLMADSLPPLFILCILSLEKISGYELRTRFRKLFFTGLGSLSLFSVYVHAWKGMQETAVTWWNNNPNIYSAPEAKIFDFSHPQFLATDFSNRRVKKFTEFRKKLNMINRYVPAWGSVLFPENPMEFKDLMWQAKKKKLNINYHWFLDQKELFAKGSPRFYIPEAGFWDFVGTPEKYAVRLYPGKYPLGNVVRDLCKGCIGYLAIKDDGAASLSEFSKVAFENLGSNIRQLKFRDSWVCVFNSDTVLAEKITSEGKVWLTYKEGNQNAVLFSSAVEQGNFASIKIWGEERSVDGHGVNLVVTDSLSRFLYATYFDTYRFDAMETPMMEVTILNRGYQTQ